MSVRLTVAYPGGGVFPQQVALAFQEHGALDAFVTGVAFRPDGALIKTLHRLGPQGRSVARELERRSTFLDPSLVKTVPFWEMARLLAARAGADPVLVDRLWDRASHVFDATVAQRYAPNTEAIYAYEYTAKASFERAKQEGAFAVLDLPSLNNRAYEALQQAERERFPELRSKADPYFASKFARRQARRDSEVELADVLVANSNLTRRSHVEAGVDPEKFIVVPLGAPPAIEAVTRAFDPATPLRVVWAGAFSLRKGAHLLLEALRAFPRRTGLQLDVYGSRQLSDTMMGEAIEGVTFHGSQPQSRLFAAFEAADVLIFPTLSDGFGLVVGEAFARGLPVITTDQAGSTDLVKSGENGLIIPAGDVGAIQRALEWSLDNREALHRMRFKALRTAQGWQWSDYRRVLFDSLNTKLKGL